MGQNRGPGDGGGCEAGGEGGGGGFVLTAEPPRAKTKAAGTADGDERHHRSGAGALAGAAGRSVATFA